MSWNYLESVLSDTKSSYEETCTREKITSLAFDDSSHMNLAIGKPKSKTLCRFYLSGKCSFGSRCQFSHVDFREDSSKNFKSSSEFCIFFRSGHCKYGSSCALKHDLNEKYAEDNQTVLMNQLNFENFASKLSLSNSPKSSVCRNSLLPSFLVDELHLDESDNHHQQNLVQSDNCASEPEPELEIDSVIFFPERTTLSSPSVHFAAKSHQSPSMNFSIPQISYGEAISSGLLSAQEFKSGHSSNPDSYFTNLETSTVGDEAFSQSIPETGDDLCAFSIMGKCRYGIYCRSVHGLQCPRCLLYVLHPTDMERNEDHLNECLSKPESAPIAQLHQIKCGLCDYPVLQGSDPRFGLLNCNHCFCLNCIRTWRSTHFDARKENSRSCPDCKEVTYFIVPSSTWIDDQIEKFKIIEQYKKRMSIIPCKYYDYGRGDCPFGSSCFYEHRIDYNEKSGPRLPILLDHREQIAKVREAKLSDYIVFKTAPARNKKK